MDQRKELCSCKLSFSPLEVQYSGGYAFIDDDDQSDLEALRDTRLYVDAHLRLGTAAGPTAVNTLHLDESVEVILLDQGSFIILDDVPENGLKIDGLISAPPLASVYYADPDVYPGGFFRFEANDDLELSPIRISRAKFVNISWFGLPNDLPVNHELLRRAITARWSSKIPLYFPAGLYQFQEQINQITVANRIPALSLIGDDPETTVIQYAGTATQPAVQSSQHS